MTLTSELLPAQEEFIYLNHKLPMDLVVYQGGYGSGKTYAGSFLGLMLCLKYPGIRGLVGALNIPTVRDTTIRNGWFVHMRMLGLKLGEDYKYNITDGNIQFNNGPNGFEDGSCVYIRHFEEPDKLRSLDVGFIEVEEMSLIPESTFKELLGRLRQTKLSNNEPLLTRRLFGHTNPEPDKGWIHKHFVEKNEYTRVGSFKDEQKQYEIVKEGERIKGVYRSISKIQDVEMGGKTHSISYRLVIAPTTQNHFLPPDYIANMKSSFSPEDYDVNVLGNFGNYSFGLVSKGFNRIRQVKPRIEIDTALPVHLTCDFNVDPMCWCVAQKYKYHVNFIDEVVCEGGINITDALHIFCRRYPMGSNPYIILNGDASGHGRHVLSAKSNATFYSTMQGYLEDRGYVVKVETCRKNPEKFDKAQAWNAMLRNANGEHHIFISEKCKYLLYSIENLKWRTGTSDYELASTTLLKRDHDAKFRDHPYDAASGLVHYYFPIRRDNLKNPQEYRERKIDSRFPILGLEE